ncbi:MAG: 50S ribosomal protein L33 [Chloroflexi bacterium]|nr:50S ribosomal protein L33 [Chloroflexota bacterium]
MARKKLGNRILITLTCGECHERNYTTEKSRRNDTERLEFRKYCATCRTHRVHREVR